MSKNITIDVTRSSLNDATSALVYNINLLEKFKERHKETMSDSIKKAADELIQDNLELVNALGKIYRVSDSDNISLSLNDKQISRLFMSIGDAFKNCEGEKQLAEYHIKTLQEKIKDYEKLLDKYEKLYGEIVSVTSNKEGVNNG